MSLLGDHAFEASSNGRLEGHIGKPGLRIGDGEQAGQLASGLNDGDGLVARHLRLGLGSHLVDEPSQLGGELGVALRAAWAATCIAME
jgi:hypothetical protein